MINTLVVLKIVSGIQKLETEQPELINGEPQFNDSEGAEPENELAELLAEAADSITGLFKVSMILRRPEAIDRHSKTTTIGKYDRHYGKDYIWHKVPFLRKENSGDEWLIERLGEANTRRREYFSYCEKHHGRLSYVPAPDNRDTGAVSGEKEEIPKVRMIPITRSVATSDLPPSLLAPTTATTFDENWQRDDEVDTRSQTSYSMSISSGVEAAMRIPSQPKASINGKQFECPFCFTIQMVKDTDAWK